MTGIIMKSNDAPYFTQTSNAPYDRHRYKIICKDNSVKIVSSWEEAQTAWWNYPQYISIIEVIDEKQPKPQGFQ